MRVRLEYGREGLDVELPDERVVRSLAYKDAHPLPDPAAALRKVLDSPRAAAPLIQLAAGRRTACLVVCDITRPVPNEMILGPVLRDLEVAGIARDDILILIATGLHRPRTTASRTTTGKCPQSTPTWVTARVACRSGSIRDTWPRI